MQIGEVAETTGFSADTLRYYEKIGLMPRVGRNASGRRNYDRNDLARLAFIKRAQAVDFSLADIKALLTLRDRSRAPRQTVLKLTEHKLDEINRKLTDIRHLKGELTLLLNLCRAAPGEECPIIEQFEGK